MKFFAWKFIRSILLTRNKLRQNKNEYECWVPILAKSDENINNLFQTCDFISRIWSTTNPNCPKSNDNNLQISDWLEYIWTNRNWYNKIVYNSVETFTTIMCTIWNHRNSIVFNTTNVPSCYYWYKYRCTVYFLKALTLVSQLTL